MRNCERCGGEVSWTKDTVELQGGVAATLCNACRREFNTLFFDSEEFAAAVSHAGQAAHYDSLAVAGQPVSQDAWNDLAIREAEVKKAFSALANRFLASVPAKVK